jgi:uncharacterized protein (DUF983 family)
MSEPEFTAEEQAILNHVVLHQLEVSPTGRCLECGRGRIFHLLKPLDCAAVVGMARARVEDCP